jgi:hypothetical protein
MRIEQERAPFGRVGQAVPPVGIFGRVAGTVAVTRWKQEGAQMSVLALVSRSGQALSPDKFTLGR